MADANSARLGEKMGSLTTAFFMSASLVSGCTGQTAPHPKDGEALEAESESSPGDPPRTTPSGGAGGRIDVGSVSPTPTDGTEDSGPRDLGGAGGVAQQEEELFGSGDLTVLLILDKSGSMGTIWDGDTRWNTAVHAFFGGLQGVEGQVTVGALVFPQPGGCDVDPVNAPSQFAFQSGYDFILEWSEKKVDFFPSGSTPLGLAFEQADAAISEAHESGLLEERRFRVMVVTDGEPNCGTNPERLFHLANSWRELGIEVHVMGLPGSEQAANLLDTLATVGGTTDYVAPTTGDNAEDTFYDLVR